MRKRIDDYIPSDADIHIDVYGRLCIATSDGVREKTTVEDYVRRVKAQAWLDGWNAHDTDPDTYANPYECRPFEMDDPEAIRRSEEKWASI